LSPAKADCEKASPPKRIAAVIDTPKKMVIGLINMNNIL
jgi:hypothetical protein